MKDLILNRVHIVAFFFYTLFVAASAPAQTSAAKSYPLNSPQGQAIHHNMMQMQQMQMIQKQNQGPRPSLADNAKKFKKSKKKKNTHS